MTDQPAAAGLPILGSAVDARPGSSSSATVVLSIVAIVLDFGLHADATVLFVVVGRGDPGARLGRRPLHRAARRR